MSAQMHELGAAYALNALPAEEYELFEEHLAECASCRGEAAAFADAVARLGSAVETTPPPNLRTAVLERIRQPAQSSSVSSLPAPQRAVAFSMTWLATAAVLVLVLFVGLLLFQQQSVTQLETQRRQVAAVMTAPDAVVARDTVKGSGRVLVVASDQLNRAVVMAADLPQLDPGKTYQLWLMAGDRPRSVGTLEPAADAPAARLHALGGADSFAITVEPTGGSPRPTTPIIATAQLA